MLRRALEWIQSHPEIIGGAFAFSMLTLVGGAFGAAWLLVRIPEDHFAPQRPKRPFSSRRHPWLRLLFRLLRNALGLLLLAVGIVMLVAPGPGLVSVLASLMLLEIPGRRAAARWILRRRAVRETVDRTRARAGRPPLRLD